MTKPLTPDEISDLKNATDVLANPTNSDLENSTVVEKAAEKPPRSALALLKCFLETKTEYGNSVGDSDRLALLIEFKKSVRQLSNDLSNSPKTRENFIKAAFAVVTDIPTESLVYVMEALREATKVMDAIWTPHAPWFEPASEGRMGIYNVFTRPQAHF